MDYIITEDSGTGLELWQKINEVRWNSHYTVLSSAGVDNMYARIKNEDIFKNDTVQVSLEKGSSLLVCIDGYGKSANKVLLNVIGYCEEHGIELFLTTYPCMEAAILTFDLLSLWMSFPKSNIPFDNMTSWDEMEKSRLYASLLNYMHSSISKCKEYWLNPMLVRRFGKNNPENMAADVLDYLTSRRTTKADFHISKSDFGKCWTADCNALRMFRAGDGTMQGEMMCATPKLACSLIDTSPSVCEKLDLLLKYSSLGTNIEHWRK